MSLKSENVIGFCVQGPQIGRNRTGTLGSGQQNREEKREECVHHAAYFSLLNDARGTRHFPSAIAAKREFFVGKRDALKTWY